ncbi:MAG: hypothetical protein IPM51_09810 [Sphingobacteriaceae bacterium]|nr:hypothetical protein [Sphingobacteriaceae bacterium]
MKNNKLLTAMLITFIFTLLIISRAMATSNPIMCDHEACKGLGFHKIHLKQTNK